MAQLVKSLPAIHETVGNAGDPCLISGLGRSPGGGNSNLLQYSCLQNPTGRGTWRAAVHGVTADGHNLATKPPPTIKDIVCLGEEITFFTLEFASFWTFFFIVWIKQTIINYTFFFLCIFWPLSIKKKVFLTLFSTTVPNVPVMFSLTCLWVH